MLPDLYPVSAGAALVGQREIAVSVGVVLPYLVPVQQLEVEIALQVVGVRAVELKFRRIRTCYGDGNL